MSPEQVLVQQLASVATRLEAMRALAGGITSTELRRAVLSDAAFDALVEGTRDSNAKVRWWSIQILDHVPDDRAIAVFVEALDDPVPRVRRNAAHALGCVVCKPTWSGELTDAVTERLIDVATNDPNPKVRLEAALALR